MVPVLIVIVYTSIRNVQTNLISFFFNLSVPVDKMYATSIKNVQWTNHLWTKCLVYKYSQSKRMDIFPVDKWSYIPCL